MRAFLALLLASCAHASAWTAARTCEPWPGVRVATEGNCAWLGQAFDCAAATAEEDGAATRAELHSAARQVSFVVLPVPRLYVNAAGREVAGLMACDELPRVILDETLQGLGHELLHARDCVTGRRMAEPDRGWRRFWALGAWR